MPANLTPQYLEVEEKFKQANSDQEKLQALQEMLKMIPKHKGTEKLQADIKKKISNYKKLAQKKEKKVNHVTVDSQGLPQIVVVGAPNVGKSKLLSVIANTELKVQDYPFTTRLPAPVIVTYEDVRMQLVDMPPIANTYFENFIPSIIRAADAVLWLIDFSDQDILENTQGLRQKLLEQKIYLQVGNKKEEQCINKRTLIVGTKGDLDIEEDQEVACELLGEEFKCFLVSAQTNLNLEKLKKKLFELLDLIRIYPKPPGQKADMDNPILLPKNSSVIDLAAKIHKDLVKELKSARIWNSSEHVDGQNVPRDSVLYDKNIVELSK